MCFVEKKYTGTCGEAFLWYYWCMKIIMMGRGHGRESSGKRHFNYQYTNFLSLRDKESVIVRTVNPVHASEK